MVADYKKDTSVRAIDRALLILETIAYGGTLSINDLHKKLGLNKASLSRIASTLHHNGYLNRDPKTGEYSLSLRAFEVGVQAVQSLDYLSLIRSSLSELANSLDVVAQFSVEDQNALICIESFERESTALSVYTRIGQRFQLHATSAGKAILSTYSDEEIVKKWNEIEHHSPTPKTITDINALMVDIAKTRQRNYALDIEETAPNLFCVGSILMNYNRKPIGAISLSTNSLTLEEEELLSTTLLQHTRRISNLLGYTHL